MVSCSMNAELFEAHAVLAVRSAFDRPTLVLAGQELGTGLPVALVPEHFAKHVFHLLHFIQIITSWVNNVGEVSSFKEASRIVKKHFGCIHLLPIGIIAQYAILSSKIFRPQVVVFKSFLIFIQF